MRRAVRWAVRGVLVVTGVLALGVLAIVIALHTAWGRELIRAKAEAAIAASFPGSRVGKVEGSALGTLVVRDLVIAGGDGQPMVTVGRAELEVELWPLVTHTVHVDRLELDDVTVVPRPPPPPPPGPASPPAWSVEIDDLQVRRARLVEPDGTTELDQLSVDAAVAIPAKGALLANLRAAGTWRGQPVVAAALARRLDDTTEVPFVAAVVGGADPVRVVATSVRARDGGEVDGAAVARVPAAAARELAAVALPGDVTAAISAAPGGAIELHAALAGATVHGLLAVDAPARSARGLVIADVPDVAALAGGTLAGHATAVAALEADRAHVRGLISARATRDGHRALALVALDATRTGAWTLADASSDAGAAHATATATLARTGDTLALTRGTLDGRAAHLAAALADGTRAAVRLAALHLAGSGRLWPDPDVRGSGTVDAAGLAGAGYAASRLHVRLDGVRAGLAATTGRVHVDLAGARRGATRLGSATLDAHARIAAGGAIDVDLDAHRVRTAAGGTWAGRGGHLAITPAAIALSGLHTGHAGGALVADARLERGSGDLAAELRARGVALAALAPGLAGSLGGRARIARRAGRWDATAALDGHGVVIAPGRAPLDTAATLALHGRRLAITAGASGAAIGGAKASVELVGPRDVTDARAWQRLGRGAIRSLKLELDDLALAGASPALSGTLAGTAELTASSASGELHLRGLHAHAGDVAADVTLAPRPGGLRAELTAQLADVAAAQGELQIALPAHPLDPVAWRALGRRALAGASLRAAGVAFDPALLRRLGVAAPLAGTVDVTAELGEGARSYHATLAVHRLRGGPLVRPLDLVLDASGDDADNHVTGAVRAGELALLGLDVHVRGALGRLDRAQLLAMPVAGTIGLPGLAGAAPAPELAVPALLGVVGRRDVLAGTLAGSIALGGTLGRPTADAHLAARDLQIRASVEGRAPARLADLALAARWDGHEGSLDLLAHEPGGALLHIAGHGRPDRPRELAGSLEAAGFDVAPLTAFAPGALGAARGVLDASLTLQGFDPDTGKLRGRLHVRDARVPLHDLIGTLRKADLAVTVVDHTVTAKLSGKLGRGDVTGSATVELAGSTPTRADIALGLREITLIRAHQPVIAADVTAHLVHGKRWTGTIAIDHGHVVVPSRGGQELLEATPPADMTFVDAPPPKVTPLLHRPPPSTPWLVADVTLAPTTIDVRDVEYQVTGRISAKRLRLLVGGDSIGASGTISAQRGDIELFGQRSQLDHGTAVFDGTLDPVLDVRVVRDLDTMTVYADVSGRASKPEVAFSSDSGSYSQGDLLAFFVGGQPDAARGEVGQAAAAAGAGYASSLITKKLNKLLPVKLKLDLRYETATASNSEAIGLGTWLDSDTYIEAHQHVSPRADEAVNEALIEYHLLGDWLLRGTMSVEGYDSGEIEHRWHW